MIKYLAQQLLDYLPLASTLYIMYYVFFVVVVRERQFFIEIVVNNLCFGLYEVFVNFSKPKKNWSQKFHFSSRMSFFHRDNSKFFLLRSL